MTKERLQAVLLLYGDKLKTDGYAPERNGEAVPKWTRLRHLAWMVGEAIRFTEEDEIEKSMRWLGFIQGVFWVLKYRSIEEMKGDNRMPEGEPLLSRIGELRRNCIGCRIEAEIGTEEDPHPVPERFHTCTPKEAR